MYMNGFNIMHYSSSFPRNTWGGYVVYYLNLIFYVRVDKDTDKAAGLVFRELVNSGATYNGPL